MVVAGLLLVGLVVLASAESADRQPSGDAAIQRGKVQNGRYVGQTQGKVDDRSGQETGAGRVVFTKKGKRIKKLTVGLAAGCLSSAGNYTIENVATQVKSVKLSEGGKFHAKGQDKNGVRYDIRGKFRSAKRAKGKLEVSKFRVVSLVTYESTLCSASRAWSATRSKS